MKTSITHSVAFGRQGNASSYQAYGWLGGENGFNWTRGYESALFFNNFHCPYGLVVEAYFHPHIQSAGPKSQRIDFSVNGSNIGFSVLDGPTRVAFLASPTDHRDNYIVLSIAHPDAFTTQEGHPLLALAAFEIRLLRVEEELAKIPLRSANSLFLNDPDASPSEILEKVRSYTKTDPLDIISCFEMLAGNCEFGGIQRRFGAEPLSLLRFSGATVESAIRGLDNQFRDIGKELEANISPDATKEWMIFDKNYHLQYHTFISSNSMSREEIIRKEAIKVAFLKRKFLEDLAEPRKIFVCVDRFKQPICAAIPPFLALNRHEKHSMLWVSESIEGDIGSVREILPNLFVAKIDRLAKHGYPHEASLNYWMSIMVNTWDLNYRGKL